MTLQIGVGGAATPSGKARMLSRANGAPTKLSKRAEKRRRRKGKAKAVDQSSNGSMDIIDLTFDDTSRSSSISGGARKAARSQDAEPGPSAPGSIRSIGVEAFDRIPKSILAGVSRPSPEQEQPGGSIDPSQRDVDIFIDHTPVVHTTGTTNNPSNPTTGEPLILVPPAQAPDTSDSPPGPSAVASSSKPTAPSLELLLPDNVILDDPSDTSLASLADPNDMEGLHFLDTDTTKGVSRYFDATASEPTVAEASFLATADQSKICSNCKRPGHKRQACPHTLCPVCGAVDAHERRDCPYSLVCFGCGQRGHRQTNCPDPKMRNSKKRGCDRCGARDHPENSCPSLWRQYAYYSVEERAAVQNAKLSSTAWHKEAIGGDEAEEWCYNCAREGHLGDDCPQYRVSGARLYTPSAFSYAMQSRGPFFHPTSRDPPMPKPEHKRWDDEETVLPFASKGFGGAEAGKKTREKAMRAMQSREEDDDYTEDWFGPTRSGETGQRTNERIRERKSNKAGPHGASPNRGTMGRRLPFGHSDLMPTRQSRQPTIAFGKLSLPNGAAPITPSGMGKKYQGLPPPVSPQSSGKQRQNRQIPAHGPNRANRNSTTNSLKVSDKPKSGIKSRKRKVEDDRDWEIEWQNAGIGGGSVVGWGKDLDREDRAVKKMKGKQGPPTPANKGKGQRAGNKAPGQRYTGGYS